MPQLRNAETLERVGQRRLLALQTLNNRVGLYFFSGHLLLTLTTGALLWLALDSIWIAPALVLHGIVLVHWFAPFHECLHGTAFRSPWLNTLVGWFAGLIIIIVPPYFKYEHAAHHAFTSDPLKDPERIPIGETFWGYLYYATAIPYFIGLFSVLLRLPFAKFTPDERRFLPARRRREVVRAVWLMWAFYIALIGLSVWTQSTAALLLWFLPRVVGEPFMRLIRMSEHVGCAKVPDMLRNTRTVITVWPLRLLAWNMCFHAEHHSLPRVPFHALPALHNIIRDRLSFICRGYYRAQLELIRNGLRNSGYGRHS